MQPLYVHKKENMELFSLAVLSSCGFSHDYFNHQVVAQTFCWWLKSVGHNFPSIIWQQQKKSMFLYLPWTVLISVKNVQLVNGNRNVSVSYDKGHQRNVWISLHKTAGHLTTYCNKTNGLKGRRHFNTGKSTSVQATPPLKAWMWPNKTMSN